MEQKELDAYYFEIAKAVSTRSTCMFGNVGCVIVDCDDNIIAASCLIDKTDVLNCRRDCMCSYLEREKASDIFGFPERCDYMFPEINAILSTDRYRLKGATIYIYAYDIEKEKTITVDLTKTLSKVILNSGIKRIVTT